MKILVLAAGYGTRLKAIAANTPKPLLPINDKPLINYILDRVKDLNDLEELIVVTNNKFFVQFEEWAKEMINFPCPIRVVNDQTMSNDDRLGSIGDIDYVLKHENVEDDLLVIGGDNLFDYNVNDYIIAAQENPGSITIGLYDIESLEEAKLYGVVSLDDNGKLLSFEEKPSQPKSTLIAMCFYYLPQQTLPLVSQYLTEIEKSDTAGDYIRWLHEKSDVYGFKFSGKWYDIGSVESYQEAQQKFTN